MNKKITEQIDTINKVSKPFLNSNVKTITLKKIEEVLSLDGHTYNEYDEELEESSNNS